MDHICYADFEASTDGVHKPYCCCFNIDGVDGYYYGWGCNIQFLNKLETGSLVYFHNLSYDICFIIDHLDWIANNPIIKGGKTYSLKGSYKGKKLWFKDSLAIIPVSLSRFPKMFGLDSGRKEVFPYKYYSSERTNQIWGDVREAMEYVKEEDREAFMKNVDEIAKGEDGKFNMRDYCVFYCKQDVNILRKGFEWFRESVMKEFELDVYDFVSISSIANKVMEMRCYWLNGNLYDLANTPREFISRCITGGRCMLRDEMKVRSNNVVVDFDAVSLYPSAMARLYCLSGQPKVLSGEMLSSEYLMSHLFEDKQEEAMGERFISGFFVEVEIKQVRKKRHFPMIVSGEDGCQSVCCGRCYVDHIAFEDLVKYFGVEMKVIRGYYYRDNRDFRIREVVKDLFELRRKYAAEENPLQEIVKLILNSIYGKTILKPIDVTNKFVKV